MLDQQQSLTYFTYTYKLITDTSKPCILINKLVFFFFFFFFKYVSHIFSMYITDYAIKYAAIHK